MDIFNYVTIASQFMIAGAAFECICILLGYVIFSVFKLLQGGENL